jgi:hypothetical protein
MMPQGADRIMDEYVHLYCCTNKECGSAYEEYSDLKSKRKYEKDRWWNPKTESFEHD